MKWIPLFCPFITSVKIFATEALTLQHKLLLLLILYRVQELGRHFMLHHFSVEARYTQNLGSLNNA